MSGAIPASVQASLGAIEQARKDNMNLQLAVTKQNIESQKWDQIRGQ